MKNWRNLLFLIGFLGFCAWYGGTWAYKTQYVEPRAKLQTEIKQYEAGKIQLENQISYQENMLRQLDTQRLYHRSLPTANARTLYHSWLIEAGDVCEFENLAVNAQGWRYTGSRSYMGTYYLSARTTLDCLSRFLYEFYWAPYVHRITLLNIKPIDNADLVDIEIQIEGLVIPPSLVGYNSEYPLRDRLPEGYWPRLSSGRLETYTEPINSRNLLQFARSGIDASDYVRLTGIVITGGEPEFWFTNRLNDQTLRYKLNEPFRVGSFIGKIVEVANRDVILETTGTFSRPGMRWILSQGEDLAKATAIPEEF